jgi:hypothetical protein
MGLYDVNYANVGQQLLPPDKRGNFMTRWVAAMLRPLQWLVDIRLNSYRNGSTAPPYLNSTTYAKGDLVLYRYSVYESQVNGNLGNDPLNTTYWSKVQDNFIGVLERLKYNGHTLILTYALNKYFGTTFRQPNNVSDIYIAINPKPTSVFLVGDTEVQSSKVYYNTSSEFVVNSYSFAAYTNMTIFVPLAVYNALDVDPANRERIIRNFADQYVVGGITYSVATY